jgi:hypothetical protein
MDNNHVRSKQGCSIYPWVRVPTSVSEGMTDIPPSILSLFFVFFFVGIRTILGVVCRLIFIVHTNNHNHNHNNSSKLKRKQRQQKTPIRNSPSFLPFFANPNPLKTPHPFTLY